MEGLVLLNIIFFVFGLCIFFRISKILTKLIELEEQIFSIENLFTFSTTVNKFNTKSSINKKSFTSLPDPQT